MAYIWYHFQLCFCTVSNDVVSQVPCEAPWRVVNKVTSSALDVISGTAEGIADWCKSGAEEGVMGKASNFGCWKGRIPGHKLKSSMMLATSHWVQSKGDLCHTTQIVARFLTLQSLAMHQRSCTEGDLLAQGIPLLAELKPPGPHCHNIRHSLGPMPWCPCHLHMLNLLNKYTASSKPIPIKNQWC